MKLLFFETAGFFGNPDSVHYSFNPVGIFGIIR